MGEFFDTIQQAMIEGPLTPAELAQHQIANRVASLMSELDDLISLSRKPAQSDAQQAIAQDWKAFDTIATKAQFLASYGEVRQRSPGLRLIRGRK